MQPALGALSTAVSLQVELLLFSGFGNARDQYTLSQNKRGKKMLWSSTNARYSEGKIVK